MRNLSLFEDERLTLDDAIDLTRQSLLAYITTYQRIAVAFSGGKDSTTVLTLLLHFIATGQLPLHYDQVTVLYADTRMELPMLHQAALGQLDQPVPTVPTANRHAVIEPAETIRVEDCGFRMFKVPEIQRAMAFPDDYQLLGNQDERVKMLGNAVTPPPMERMIAACLDVYGRMGRS